MNRIADILSGIIGVALIAFGFYAVANTGAIAAMTGLDPVGVLGQNESRAIYGGSFWAMGGLILFALTSARFKAPLLLAIGLLFIGFIAGRLVSITIDGYEPAVAQAIESELVAAAVLITAGMLSRRRMSA